MKCLKSARARRRPAVPPRLQIAHDIHSEDALEFAAILGDRSRNRAAQHGRIPAAVLG